MKKEEIEGGKGVPERLGSLGDFVEPTMLGRRVFELLGMTDTILFVVRERRRFLNRIDWIVKYFVGSSIKIGSFIKINTDEFLWFSLPLF